MSRQHSTLTLADGRRLDVRTTGPDDGEALLLLHGAQAGGHGDDIAAGRQHDLDLAGRLGARTVRPAT